MTNDKKHCSCCGRYLVNPKHTTMKEQFCRNCGNHHLAEILQEKKRFLARMDWCSALFYGSGGSRQDSRCADIRFLSITFKSPASIRSPAMLEKKRRLLAEFCDYCCEQCHKNESEVGKLIPHRIKREYEGGTYELRNIKMVCLHCHQLYHSNEFPRVKSKWRYFI